LLVHDHGEPVGCVDHRDHADQRGDLVVVVVLAHGRPPLVGHAEAGVGEPGALFGERGRGPLGALQETWLRGAGVDPDTVENQRAFLVRITTRQALGRLRTLGRSSAPRRWAASWVPDWPISPPRRFSRYRSMATRR